LACDVLLQAKGAKACPFVGWSGRRPELSELSFLIRLFEEMARQDGEAVEKSFFDAIGLRELENERLRVHFADGDGLAANDQLIALGRMDTFIEVDAKGKKHIVGIERMPIRETQPLAQSERVLKAVGGDFPGFCESGFGELRCAVDVNEVRLHCTDYFARRRIGGRKRVQSLRFSTERNDEPSA
jgi:hypothetical protein